MPPLLALLAQTGPPLLPVLQSHAAASVSRPPRGFLRPHLTVALGLFVVGLPVLAFFINWS